MPVYRQTERLGCWVTWEKDVEAENQDDAFDRFSNGEGEQVSETIGDCIDGYDEMVSMELAPEPEPMRTITIPKPTWHLLVVTHEEGANTSLHRTERGACAALYGFVEAHWVAEDCPSQYGALAGKDQDTAISNYFEWMQDSGESWEIRPIQLEK